jgi:uncharacterized membrane protein YhhN
MESLFVVVTAIGLLGVLYAEWTGTQSLQWSMKPLASTGFVALAITRGIDDPYAQAVLAALVLSWFGDVLLIPKGAKRAFLLGLIAFLLGHVGFVVAFIVRGASWPAVAVSSALLLVPAALVGRYFASRAPQTLRAPVVAYISVISVMVALAVGTSAVAFDPKIAVAAPLFYASDVFVARQRFLGPNRWNRVLGLPLYYTAQVLFALSIGAAG